MSADHRVSWDHSGCEHAPLADDSGDDECYPTGTITCEAEGPGIAFCRYSCDCEESWYLCTHPKDHADPEEHNDPAGPHCREGHVLTIGECNAVLCIEQSDVTECAVDQPLTDFHDGPVDVSYEGDGIYVWEYA